MEGAGAERRTGGLWGSHPEQQLNTMRGLSSGRKLLDWVSRRKTWRPGKPG